MESLFFSAQILTGVPFVLMFHDTRPHCNALFGLLLHAASDPDNFLAVVSGLFLLAAFQSITGVVVRVRMPVAAEPVTKSYMRVVRRAAGRLVRLAFHLQLDFLGGETVSPPSALDSLTTLTNPSPKPTQICTVTSAPCPYATVGGIIAP